MPPSITPQSFVAKWQDNTLKERAAAQEHFIDLCRLVGHPTPSEDDPTGERFTFEAGADKLGGKQGWADVWKRNYFAFEYKGRHANLDKAYQQLLLYRESLLNPPLLVVCDIDRILIHTNFTNTVKRVIEIGLQDLLTADGIRNLRAVFYEPEYFRSTQTTEQVTREAAIEFAHLADHLQNQGQDPHEIAHLSIRLLFCLFAEDTELLPTALFTRLVDSGRRNPAAFEIQLRQLFGAMATGGYFGEHEIHFFDGGLFDNDHVLGLDAQGLGILQRIAILDWAAIEPSIFGTLFQRSLDPSRRSQLGAHYTSKEDILLIVEPVLMAPLRREWQEIQVKATEAAEKRSQATTTQSRNRYLHELEDLIIGFAQKLSAIRVLDPACGSGNFLYVALRLLLDLWKEVALFAGSMGMTLLLPLPGQAPSPEQLFGIEIDPYAHELAQATVWIGYLQWLHENGYSVPSEPILKRLDNIRRMDAILAFDVEGKPVEPEWPEAEVIVGNPPFLGSKVMRLELSDEYVRQLHTLYANRIVHEADLVCYWFEKARVLIANEEVERAGLLSTNSIRGGANRKVLEGIKTSGDIFMAWSDREWVLDGAAVRVSMVGFDKGSEHIKVLDGQIVTTINPDLTSTADLTVARRLEENMGMSFMGVTPAGPFTVNDAQARELLAQPLNPNGRPNTDVVRPFFNGIDLARRQRQEWIVNFTGMALEEASLYEKPFEYVLVNVKPARLKSRIPDAPWWLYTRSRPAMFAAIKNLSRYIATSQVSKYRVFAWLSNTVLPDHALIVFARDDDYFFGVLHSRFHELWSLGMGTWLGVGNDPRYTPTTTFETFPFPWPPGKEPTDDPRVQAIAQAAQDLNSKREAWLNPPGMAEADLKKRTLTNLYNARPTWLDLAHKKLDAAVAAAYGWPADLSDEEILTRLLALNLAPRGLPAARDKLPYSYGGN
jgi:type II restriction/modification system DNA methylase subunit YeeA